MDIKSKIREAKRPEATVDICLRGDLAAEYEALQAALEQLPTKDSLGDSKRVQIREDQKRIREQMAEAEVVFRLRALRRPDYQSLLDEHPPRRQGDDLDPLDALVGYNRATFFEPLIKASVVEPELDEGDWKLLFEEGLTDGQFDHLGHTALGLNRRKVDIPFSSADSNGTPS